MKALGIVDLSQLEWNVITKVFVNLYVFATFHICIFNRFEVVAKISKEWFENRCLNVLKFEGQTFCVNM